MFKCFVSCCFRFTFAFASSCNADPNDLPPNLSTPPAHCCKCHLGCSLCVIVASSARCLEQNSQVAPLEKNVAFVTLPPNIQKHHSSHTTWHEQQQQQQVKSALGTCWVRCKVCYSKRAEAEAKRKNHSILCRAIFYLIRFWFAELSW